MLDLNVEIFFISIKISLFLSLPFRNDCVQPNHLCVIIDYIIIPNYKHLHKLETTAIYILL